MLVLWDFNLRNMKKIKIIIVGTEILFFLTFILISTNVIFKIRIGLSTILTFYLIKVAFIYLYNRGLKLLKDREIKDVEIIYINVFFYILLLTIIILLTQRYFQY